MTEIETLDFTQPLIPEPFHMPSVKVKWCRKTIPDEMINYHMARITLALGKKGGGKSAFLEAGALRHEQVIDLLGSRDDEGLAWLRKNAPEKDMLLVTGDNVDCDCSWPTCKISDMTTTKLLSKNLIITTDSLYSSQKSKFEGVNGLTDLFWGRREYDPEKPVAVIMRELSDFIYSRIVQDGMNIKEAKADFIVFQRQLRHFGYSPYMDTIRWTSVDKEIRDLADYLVIKKVGSQGLPHDIQYLYGYINPLRLAALPPNKFMIVTESASIGKGIFEKPAFHKEEGVDLLRELGIKLTYGEEPEVSSTQRVGDREHAEIIKLYQQGFAMSEVATKTGRSDYTVSTHVRKHDGNIEKHGICDSCTRGGCDLAKTKVTRVFLKKTSG